jgi:hypothetical protein
MKEAVRLNTSAFWGDGESGGVGHLKHPNEAAGWHFQARAWPWDVEVRDENRGMDGLQTWTQVKA